MHSTGAKRLIQTQEFCRARTAPVQQRQDSLEGDRDFGYKIVHDIDGIGKLPLPKPSSTPDVVPWLLPRYKRVMAARGWLPGDRQHHGWEALRCRFRRSSTLAYVTSNRLESVFAMRRVVVWRSPLHLNEQSSRSILRPAAVRPPPSASYLAAPRVLAQPLLGLSFGAAYHRCRRSGNKKVWSASLL